jgi:hypothetical protein
MYVCLYLYQGCGATRNQSILCTFTQSFILFDSTPLCGRNLRIRLVHIGKSQPAKNRNLSLANFKSQLAKKKLTRTCHIRRVPSFCLASLIFAEGSTRHAVSAEVQCRLFEHGYLSDKFLHSPIQPVLITLASLTHLRPVPSSETGLMGSLFGLDEADLGLLKGNPKSRIQFYLQNATRQAIHPASAKGKPKP